MINTTAGLPLAFAIHGLLTALPSARVVLRRKADTNAGDFSARLAARPVRTFPAKQRAGFKAKLPQTGVYRFELVHDGVTLYGDKWHAQNAGDVIAWDLDTLLVASKRYVTERDVATLKEHTRHLIEVIKELENVVG